MIWPNISIIIPTLNAASVLPSCLKSVQKQKYPKNKIELILSDGGSSDNTLFLGKKFDCRVIDNPLKTAEAGKAIGVNSSTGDFILLLDSDNILPHSFWLKKMLRPLIFNPKLVGAEPIKFTYRPHSGFIERYSALLGANDPFAYISGVYDRYSYLSNHWTGLKLPTTVHPSYLSIELIPGSILPTIGANGTIFRANFLKKQIPSDYLFDIDIISQSLLTARHSLFFAKVKTSIIHTFCESSIKKFIRKQQRRLSDYYFYRQFRSFNWSSTNKTNIVKFSLYSLLIIPSLFDSLRGFIKKPDLAWFFHPLACLISFFTYSTVTAKYHLGLLKQVNRQNWKQ